MAVWKGDKAWGAVFCGIGLTLIVSLTNMAAIGLARGALIDRAWIERRGQITTLHFTRIGRSRPEVTHQASRLQIELKHTRIALPVRPLLGFETDPLGVVRLVQAPNGAIRVEIAVTRKCDYLVGRKGDQLIVRLAPPATDLNLPEDFASPRIAPPRRRHTQTASAYVSAAGQEQTSAARAGPPAIRLASAAPSDTILGPEAVPGRRIIVVDPGHGGRDPGTRSADGILEKNLALEIGRRLAGALDRRGVQTILTRDRDAFLALAQRTAIANKLSADLFVSIHMNWSSNSATTGIEAYYLNNTNDRATIRLARMENATGDGRTALDPGLNYILSDLRQQYKATESALLARVMEEQTTGELQARFGTGVGRPGVKKGPFYVLVGATAPAVLVECGFLSNAGEAHRLASAAYQQALAEGLADSLVHYLNQDVTAGTL